VRGARNRRRAYLAGAEGAGRLRLRSDILLPALPPDARGSRRRQGGGQPSRPGVSRAAHLSRVRVKLSHWRRRALAVLLVLASATAAPAAPVFPVRSSANHRYLTDSSGAPFPILGRTAWFVLSLTTDDYRRFIDDTAARGYTAIELHVVNHDPRGNRPPLD